MSLQLSAFFAQVVKLRGAVQRDGLHSHHPSLPAGISAAAPSPAEPQPDGMGQPQGHGDNPGHRDNLAPAATWTVQGEQRHRES